MPALLSVLDVANATYAPDPTYAPAPSSHPIGLCLSRANGAGVGNGRTPANEIGMEWGTVLVYVCPHSCGDAPGSTQATVRREVAVVQPDV
jgi:hypothetical protein